MGSKGPSGNTTTTQRTDNPAADVQLPFLGGLWGSADWLRQQPSLAQGSLQNYAQNQATSAWGAGAANVMPQAIQQYQALIGQGNPAAAQAGQLTTNAGQAINQGLNFSGQLAGLANNAAGQAPYWQNQFQNAGNVANQTLQGLGGGALSGLSGLSGLALGAGNPAESGLMGNAANALNNPAFASALGGMASGQYINPSTNPAYAGMIQAATQPLVNQYQTATAPQTASPFEGAGRYGSGAATNAMGQAQYGLGQGLANAVSGITNNAYNSGLNATLGAGQALGGLYNQGISNVTGALSNAGQLAQSGVNNAGNILNQAYTTGGNLANQGFSQQNAFMGNAANTGLNYLNAGLSGLAQGANAAQAGYGTANTGLTGAGNMLNLGSSTLGNLLGQAGTFGTYPESQFSAAYNAPWLGLSNESGLVGGSIGGTGSQTVSQPYFSNTGANILGGLSGAAGVASKLAPLLAGSDRRIKRDIRRIGTLRNGLPLYTFRYVGSKRMQIGLMADEVERVHPDAVITVGVNRIKMVNYTVAVQ